MDVKIRVGQENMEAVRNATRYVQTEFKETIRKQVGDTDTEI
jgi:hypothetical protein